MASMSSTSLSKPAWMCAQANQTDYLWCINWEMCVTSLTTVMLQAACASRTHTASQRALGVAHLESSGAAAHSMSRVAIRSSHTAGSKSCHQDTASSPYVVRSFRHERGPTSQVRPCGPCVCLPAGGGDAVPHRFPLVEHAFRKLPITVSFVTLIARTSGCLKAPTKMSKLSAVYWRPGARSPPTSRRWWQLMLTVARV